MRRRYLRKSNGRFRAPTLKDVGLFHCDKCGGIMEIKPTVINGFVDPYSVNNPVCPRCSGQKEGDTGLTVKTK